MGDQWLARFRHGARQRRRRPQSSRTATVFTRWCRSTKAATATTAFASGDYTSPVGTTRVAPDAAADRRRGDVRGWPAARTTPDGQYAAHRDLAEQRTRLRRLAGRLHLRGSRAAGDADPAQRVHLGPEPTTLEDYRNRYARYKTRPAPAGGARGVPVVRDLGRPRGGEQLRRVSRHKMLPTSPRFAARRARRVPGVVGAPAGTPRPARRC